MAKKRGQGEGSIAKRDDGTWWARVSLGYDENGKRKRKAFYGKTRKEVQEKLTAALNDVNNNTYVEVSKMTLSDWLDEWLSVYRKNAKKNTYDRYLGAMDYYIKPMLGGYKLKDLRRTMVQDFVNTLIDKGLSSRTIKGYYAVLEMALRQAYKDEIIPKNLVIGIMLPQIEKKESKVLTQQEQDIFIKFAEESPYGSIYILILGTGLRLGEALALTWDDIDFEKGTLRVNKTAVYAKGQGGEHFTLSVNPPKTKSSNRTIPLIQVW